MYMPEITRIPGAVGPGVDYGHEVQNMDDDDAEIRTFLSMIEAAEKTNF